MWLNLIFSKIKLFFKLSNEERRVFVEAYLLVGLMRVLILKVSFKRLTRSLIHLNTHTSQKTELTDEQLNTAIMVGGIVKKATNNTPWESPCLVQALTAQRMLEKRNIPGKIYLGIMKNDNKNDDLDSHAWTQCGDIIVTGERGYEAFSIVSAFQWGKDG